MTRLAGMLLIAVMAIGSVLMWLGIPIALIYAVAQRQESSAPSMGPYLLVLVGIVAEFVVVGKLLAMLDRRYMALHGVGPQRVRRAWNRSLRGETDGAHRGTVLDIVMMTSVAIALIALVVWFFAFAGSSLPGA
jgi:uncharacterized membrane-anchored protein